MCALTENVDMTADVLDRVASVAAFLQEVLADGKKPDVGLELSEAGLSGLIYIARDINLAVEAAKYLKR